METSALELMSEAIDALMRADAARLERLAAEVPRARGAETREERRALAEKRLALRHLLALTRRNLRLLRHAGVRPEGYGPAGS